MKFIKIPYRYLFINKKRTFISALSIFVSCIIVAIGYGWIDGMINNMINSYKNIQTGNIRVVNKDFIKFEKFKPIEYLIEDTTNIKEKINKFLDKFFSNYPKKIRKFEIIERLKFNAFAGYKNNSSIAQIFALEFNKEKERFKFEKNLIYGSSTINSSEILIAEGLAKKLNVYQNDSIIISAQTFSGGLNARKFKIKGIVKITLSNLNKSAIFMNLEDAKTLIKLPENTGTEILIFFDNAFTEILTKELKKYISDNKNEFPFNFLENYALQNLFENMGLLYNTYDLVKKVMYIVYFFIVLLASFVIINSMMMNIFERISEIGTLKAIGFSDKQIFLIHIIEGTMMGAIGGIPGSFFGYFLTYIMNYYGLDFSYVMSNIDFLIDTIIKPKASIDVLILTIILSIIAPALATMIPSNYAKKLNPNEALKHL